MSLPNWTSRRSWFHICAFVRGGGTAEVGKDDDGGTAGGAPGTLGNAGLTFGGTFTPAGYCGPGEPSTGTSLAGGAAPGTS